MGVWDGSTQWDKEFGLRVFERLVKTGGWDRHGEGPGNSRDLHCIMNVRRWGRRYWIILLKIVEVS